MLACLDSTLNLKDESFNLQLRLNRTEVHTDDMRLGMGIGYG